MVRKKERERRVWREEGVGYKVRARRVRREEGFGYKGKERRVRSCLLYTSPSPRD